MGPCMVRRRLVAGCCSIGGCGSFHAASIGSAFLLCFSRGGRTRPFGERSTSAWDFLPCLLRRLYWFPGFMERIDSAREESNKAPAPNRRPRFSLGGHGEFDY